LQGAPAGKAIAFRGIPYAAPPVGAYRFRPAAAPPAWKGVRQATEFGKACPQTAVFTNPPPTSEDCLTLNIWTTSLAAKAKLPVMVWIHGGGLVEGASSLRIFDGAHLAERGVVLVSINYRLGLLGFLAHPALSAEDPAHEVSGNWGLTDQITALTWVRDNIAHFGGDPANVTIFGESAGGESVCALMASPLPKGLFHRAIIESAQCVDVGPPLRPLRGQAGPAKETAEEQGQRIARALGCDGADAAACLRGKSADEILAVAKPKVGFFGGGEKYAFTLDGWLLPRSPKAALDAGALAKVPVIIGSNADEGTLFSPRIKRPLVFLWLLKKLFGDRAGDVAALYSAREDSSPAAMLAALVGDLVFTCPTRQAARSFANASAPVFRYFFAHAPSWQKKPLGATHGDEISFVFETVDPSASDAEKKLARSMASYWTGFAKSGTPSGTPHWRPYDAAADRYQKLDLEIAAETQLRQRECDALDGLQNPRLPDLVSEEE
jgi:para-nitrobenzyl esterase